MAGRLPLTLTPHPGESMSSHLGRLAYCYRMGARDLGAHLGLTVKGQSWGTATWAIALKPETAQRLGEQLNLEPADVGAMTLHGQTGGQLRFTPEAITAADPSIAAGPHHGQKLRRLLNQVGLAHYTSTPGCALCLDETPDVWLLDWRLPWVLTCPIHHVLLETAPTLIRGRGPNQQPVDGRWLAPAQRVLHSLSHGPSGRVFMADMAATAETLLAFECFDEVLDLGPGRTEAVAVWRASSRRQFDVFKLPPPAALSAAMPAATRAARDAAAGRRTRAHELIFKNRAATAHLEHTLRRFHDDGTLSPTLGLAARASDRTRQRLCPSIQTKTSPWESFPQILPMRIFAGDLSDLMYPLSLLAGQRLAAIGSAIHNGATSPREASELLGLDDRGHHGWYSLVGRLQREGREEQFWQAITDVADVLTREGVNYPQRRNTALNDDVRRQVQRHAGDGVDQVVSNQWLWEYWAAAHPYPAVVGSTRRRNRLALAVDELDKVQGHQLHRFLTPHSRVRVAS
jgi:TniQ